MRGGLLLALACLGASAPTLAATFTVSTFADRRDAAPGDGSCDADPAAPGAQCALRAAIQEANATPGADTILVPSGTYRLALRGSGEDAGRTGDLDLLDTVAIEGAGADVTVITAGKVKDRAFDVLPGVAATLSGLTIRKGRSPAGETGGGGIRNQGALTLSASRITRCRSADDAGAVDAQAGSIRLTDVVLIGNRARDAGGAIDVDGGTADLLRVLMKGNRAAHEGGALEATGTVVTLTEVAVRGNRARNKGGGLHNEYGGTVTLHGCTVTGNHARSGGGIHTDDFGPNTVTMSGTLVRGNEKRNCVGPIIDAGGNTDSDGSCGF